MEEQSKKITYESLWKAIIRPPRDYYTEEELGASNFQLYGKSYIRKDFDLIDCHGLILKVSIIEPDIISRPYDIMPIVIYAHANSSSRVEGINIKNCLLKRNINVCTFDFEGCGYSEGEYISLGFHEKKQLKNIVDFIENYPGVGEIGLWGRSMGAATSLIYASIDKRIKAIVVDSPFADFRRVAKEMCMAQVSIPGFLIEGAISIIGKSVYKKNKMKINEIKPIEAVKKCDIPVKFIHAKDDDLVNFQHTLDLYNNYRGISKEIKEVNGGHNGKRSTVLMESIGKFFEKCLNNDYFNIKEKEENEEKNKIYENEDINIFNENYIDNLPQKKNKTIYEEWGISVPSSNKEQPKEEKEENNKNKLNKEAKKENELHEQKENDENKSFDNEEAKENIIKTNDKIEVNINETNKEIDEKIIQTKYQRKKEDNELNQNGENMNKINHKNEINRKKEEPKSKDKNNESKNEKINLNQKGKENDLFSKKYITFYNTNKNFDSYIDACFNNQDKNKNNDKKTEDKLNEENKNTQNKEAIQSDNINANLKAPKRKTIYDDLNLRFKK